ncbi:MAG: hypothetical protein Q8N08_05740 [Methanobacteriaceae archaeon]|nr:hypothetical protein [Methanobacteriaceae archaeon]
MVKVLKNNILVPDGVTDFSYLYKVIDKDYGKNKKYKDKKEEIIGFFKNCLKKNDPIRTGILLNWFLIYSKYDRVLLLKALKTRYNLDISYIHYNDDRVSTSFL